MSLMRQRQIGEHTESFASALKAALREDPDVILVGEMRDLETIALAISAAETGHLVFGTLHTNTAPKTIDRIIDVFPTDQQTQIRAMLSESIKGVVCQQLLKTADGKGRVAAMEIMHGTAAVANLIREGKTFQIPSIMQTAKKDGMQLMDQHLLDLLKTRQVTPEEVYRCCQDKKQFETYLQ
jgi:twitching motility protein PilT